MPFSRRTMARWLTILQDSVEQLEDERNALAAAVRGNTRMGPRSAAAYERARARRRAVRP